MRKIILLFIVFMWAEGFAFAQQDTAQPSTFHIKHKDSNYCVAIGISTNEDGFKGIVTDSNGGAKLTWQRGKEGGVLLDTISISTDTTEIKELKGMITSGLIDLVAPYCFKTRLVPPGGYYVIMTIAENGYLKRSYWIDINLIKDDKDLKDKMNKLVDIVNTEFKKYYGKK